MCVLVNRDFCFFDKLNVTSKDHLYSTYKADTFHNVQFHVYENYELSILFIEFCYTKFGAEGASH